MKIIPPTKLIPLDLFLTHEPIKIDLVYADKNHPRNIFDTQIYHDDARLWMHRDLLLITLITARILNDHYKWQLEVKDCLRTVDAQEIMQEADIVKANPQWMEEPRYLSSPGVGGHPRAMAVDVCVLNKDGAPVDMGTEFDAMVPEAARNFNDLPEAVLANRKILEDAFLTAGREMNRVIWPLSSEWWDFRFPHSYNSRFEPLSDKDLPSQMQMSKKIENGIPDFDDAHFEKLGKRIIDLVDKHHANLR